jgi:hypothetical protein
MTEFQTKKMHIPELYLYSLYINNIVKLSLYRDVASLLVVANVYDMPRLQLLCKHRLSRKLNVEYAVIVWKCVGTAKEQWLR